MAKKKASPKPGTHKMPNGMMMSDAEMQAMMGKTPMMAGKKKKKGK